MGIKSLMPGSDDFISHQDIPTLANDQLSEKLSKLQHNGNLSVSEEKETVNMITEKLKTPSTQAETIGKLMNPSCAKLLEDGLTQTWTPHIDIELKHKLVNIAKQQEVSERIEALIILLAGSPGCDIPIPDQPDQPNQPNQSGRRIPVRTERVNEANVSHQRAETKVSRGNITEQGGEPPNRVNDFLKKCESEDFSGMKSLLIGESQDIKDFSRMSEEFRLTGRDGCKVLINLADDPDVGDIALELLHDQGPEVIKIIEELAPEHSTSREVIEWQITGEKPCNSATASKLAQIANMNDVDAFKTMYNKSSNTKALMEETVATGTTIVPLLIEMLGDNNPQYQVIAMDALHEMGSDVIYDLQLAKASTYPIVANNAETLLHYQLTGELPSELSNFTNDIEPPSISSSVADLLGNNPGNCLNGDGHTTISTYDIIDKLTSGESYMNTLNAMVQIGEPVMPVLCQMIIETVRR